MQARYTSVLHNKDKTNIVADRAQMQAIFTPLIPLLYTAFMHYLNSQAKKIAPQASHAPQASQAPQAPQEILQLPLPHNFYAPSLQPHCEEDMVVAE